MLVSNIFAFLTKLCALYSDLNCHLQILSVKPVVKSVTCNLEFQRLKGLMATMEPSLLMAKAMSAKQGFLVMHV